MAVKITRPPVLASAKNVTVSPSAVGNAYSIQRLYGATSLLALLTTAQAQSRGLTTGTNANLTLSGATIVIGSAISTGTSQVAAVQEASADGSASSTYLVNFNSAVVGIPTAPAAPAVSAPAVGVGSLSIPFVDNSDGGSPITGHNVYKSVVSGFALGPATLLQANYSGNSPFVDISASTTAQSYYVLTAINAVGEGSPSAQVGGTAAAALAISGTPPASAQVGVAYNFTPTTAGGSGTKTFAFTGALPSGMTFSPATGALGGTPNTVGSFAGLNITVTDAAGTSASLGAFSISVAAGASTAPAAPTFSLTSGPGQVTIAWTDGANGGSAITGHKLYRGTAAGGETLVTTITAASPYVDTGLTAGQRYYYRLSAVNAVGEGAQAAEQSALTAATAQPFQRWKDAGTNTPIATDGSSPTFAALTAPTTRPIVIDASQTFQNFDGVGFAMTDSAAERFTNGMTSAQRSTLFTEIFGTNGYSMIRVAFGGHDFTTSKDGSGNFAPYSYDDVDTDGTLTNFSINFDLQRVIPRVKDAIAVNPNIRVFASVWSPPAYFKLNNSLRMIGSDTANNQLDFTNATKMSLYAQYLVKAVQAWGAQGVPIYALCVQNEPYTTNSTNETSRGTGAQFRDLIKNYIGPAFSAAGLTTKLWSGDDGWNRTSDLFTAPLADGAAAAYIDGTAFHAYSGTPSFQATLHNSYPAKSIHMTEMRILSSATPAAAMATWLGQTMIGPLRNFASSITAWNGALDENGAPSFSWNTGRRGVVTVKSSNDNTIVRNMEYYAMALVGKNVPRGSTRIYSSELADYATNTDIEHVAFKKANGDIVNLAANLNPSSTLSATFIDAVSGQSFTASLQPLQIVAFTFTPAAAVAPTSAPTGLNAAVGTGQVTLNWTGASPGMLIYRGVTASALTLVGTAPVNATSFVDTVNNGTYYYAIAPIGGGIGARVALSGSVTVGGTSVTLGEATIAFPTALSRGVDATGTISGGSGGSFSITTSDGQSIAVAAGATTFTYKPSVSDAVSLTPTETLNGATNSPYASQPSGFNAGPSPSGPLAFLSSNGATAAAVSSSFSWSHTIEVNANALIVMIDESAYETQNTGGASTVTNTQVSINGIAMTKIDRVMGNSGAGRSRAVSAFILTNPPAGAQTIVASVPTPSGAAQASQNFFGSSLTFSGAAGTGTEASFASGATAPSATTSLSTSSPANSIVLYSLSARATAAPTAGTGQTVQRSGVAGTNTAALVTTQPGGSGVSSSGTIAATDQVAAIAIPVLSI